MNFRKLNIKGGFVVGYKSRRLVSTTPTSLKPGDILGEELFRKNYPVNDVDDTIGRLDVEQ